MANKIIEGFTESDHTDSLLSLYNDFEKDKNNASYWFPKVCGTEDALDPVGLYIPATCIVKVPVDIMGMFFMEHKTMTQTEMMEEVYKWVKNYMYPQAKKEIGDGFWFIKNGTFSNKFNFSDCHCISSDLMVMTSKIVDINYQALCFDAGGCTEMVIRRYIDPSRDVPVIYGGMPLRFEARVFYDFDNHEPLYVANYWDWDHCNEAICRDATDRIVYRHEYLRLKDKFSAQYDNIMALADRRFCGVDDLTGIWSIDLMERKEGGYYLIDMAMARTSAYWDPKKAGVDIGK